MCCLIEGPLAVKYGFLLLLYLLCKGLSYSLWRSVLATLCSGHGDKVLLIISTMLKIVDFTALLMPSHCAHVRLCKISSPCRLRSRACLRRPALQPRQDLRW